MCCEMYILDANEGANSISEQGLKDLEGRMGSWCTRLGVAQETIHVRLSYPQHLRVLL